MNFNQENLSSLANMVKENPQQVNQVLDGAKSLAQSQNLQSVSDGIDQLKQFTGGASAMSSAQDLMNSAQSFLGGEGKPATENQEQQQ
jgi:hypothetical protein